MQMAIFHFFDNFEGLPYLFDNFEGFFIKHMHYLGVVIYLFFSLLENEHVEPQKWRFGR